jgi:hypothetical protein
VCCEKAWLLFWDMDVIERIMMMNLFCIIVGGQNFGAERQTGSPKQADQLVRKCQPCFGNPDDSPGSPDRPLPVELKKRIEICSRERRVNDNTRCM